MKRFLITSYRLNTDSYNEQQLLDARLNEQEILACTPILLNMHPPSLKNADKVNEWLIQQGAAYIKLCFLPELGYQIAIHIQNAQNQIKKSN